MDNELFVNRPLEARDYSGRNVFVRIGDGALLIDKESLENQKVKKWCFLLRLKKACGGSACLLRVSEIPVLPECVTLTGCSIWLESANNDDIAYYAKKFEKFLAEIR